MSERSHHHNPAAHSRSRPTHAKKGGPSLTHRPYPTANPAISIASVPRQGGYRIAGSRRLPRTELSHSARRLPPQRHRVRALRPNKRRNDRVCHRVSNNEDTDPHTISNALLVLAMINKGKLYSYQNARFFKQTSQWRRKSWWCNLPAALILWHAGSDVMGCRRPTGGVFKYVSSDTSHAEAFPVATPRGRSSSSHEGEHHFKHFYMYFYSHKINLIIKIIISNFCIPSQTPLFPLNHMIFWGEVCYYFLKAFMPGKRNTYVTA